METFVWVLVVVCVALALGECYYRFLKAKREQHSKEICDRVGNTVDESAEAEMEDLRIETVGMIPRKKLQMRGSWRLAQDSVMSYSSFKQERENEYSKLL